MRSLCRARWATSALALMICAGIPALAGADKRSVEECATFAQDPKGDDAVTFTIRNACSVPLDCKIEWRVTCAPEAKKRRSLHPGSQKLALADGTTQTAEASAAVCGDDSWSIDDVEWSCAPNKD